MRFSRSLFSASLTVCLGILAGNSAHATTYTDATGDNNGGPEVDIASVVVSNDASNITFQINMNSNANLTTNHFANYEIGIQENGGGGGQTAINGTFGTGTTTAGNPYGNSVGISTGENFFIGSFLNDTIDSPGFSGGAQLYQYSTSGGWTQVGSNAAITEVGTGSPSTTFSFPLSALGLNPNGSSFNFDVWTSFGSPQSAYDALDNPNNATAPGTPFSSPPALYDSATATGSTFSTTVFTTSVTPEPASMLMIAAAAFPFISRRRRRSSSN
jgi:hypothetical protein